MNEPKRISPEEFALDICPPLVYRTVLASLIRAVGETLEKHGVRHWAATGTLLGTIRHQGLIPWDDDGDFVVPVEDRERVVATVLPELEANGYSLQKASGTWFKVFVPCSSMQGRLRLLHNATCDIFLLERVEGTQRMQPCDESVRIKFPNFWFNEPDVFPIKRAKFEDFMISIPYRPLLFLNRMYPNWARLCVVSGHNGTPIDDLFCKVTLRQARKMVTEHPE